MSQRLGIIGYPLKHTVSPLFQQAALEDLGLDLRYEAWEVHPSDLSSCIKEMREDDVRGFNVTVPHKRTVCQMLDGMTKGAEDLGAVNTVLNNAGKFIGYNTDTEGFIRALKEDAGFDPKDKDVLLLGAGGSARAVAVTLAAEGVASIAVANRTMERASNLTDLLRGRVAQVKTIPLEAKALAHLVNGPDLPDLIVHCTSMGMRHGPTEWETPLGSDLIPASALVYDLVYNPLETPLLRAAKRAGARVMGGLPMLIYQGAASFRLWIGKEPSLDVMFRAAQQRLGVT